jgi:hypothetical protein
MRTLLAFLCSTSLASAAPPVSAVAYHPNGSSFAAGTLGTVYLFDAEGTLIAELPGHTSRITGLAISKLNVLAVASGDAGKSGIVTLYDLRDPKAPKRLAEITAHKDIVYALQFSPEGKTLATASYDRTAKLWDAAKPEQPIHLLTDHSDTIYALAFHPDGKLLATGAADRAVKIWDTSTGKRLYTLGESTDWVYALAWNPNGKQLAASGVDKSIRVWNVDAEGGKIAFGVFAHTAAVSKLAFDRTGDTLYSVGQDKVVKSWNAATMVERATFPAQPDTVLAMTLKPDGKQLALGRFDGVLELIDPATQKVQATPLPMKPKPAMAKPQFKDRFTLLSEPANTDSARTAAKVALPVSIGGSLDRAGDTDYFRFDLKAGEQLGVQIQTAANDAKIFDPVLLLTDGEGNVLVESSNGLLGFTAPKAGTYAIGLQDREFRGGKAFDYRLHLGPIPIVTGVFPLGVTRGQETLVHVDGVHLGEPGGLTVKVPVSPTAEVGNKIAVPLPKMNGEAPLGSANVVVGEYPTLIATSLRNEVRVPGTADGILSKSNDVQTVKFAAVKGEKLAIEVHAARYGSPLDSTIEIQDLSGKPIPQATLRGVAQTFLTLRDTDSANPGIRLEAWNELDWNDYLYGGSELMRIKALPKNLDDDCQFVQVAGKRIGYLGTTPTHHPNGSAMVKVELHPPGASFPPNGLPTYTLYYRNDDGGPGFGKDSIIFFDPPATGTYQVAIRDTRGQGGSNFAYRLTVRPLKPDFTVDVSPKDPKVSVNSGLPITITATRIDNFEGPIRVRFENVPPGFTVPDTFIEAEQTSAVVSLLAHADASKASGPIFVQGTAKVRDTTIAHEAKLGLPLVVAAGDILNVQPLGSEITLKPGTQTKIKVRIERTKGFNERVPLEVRGLPHGVRVLNLGLNNILVLPNQTEREIVIYAEKFVKPLEIPIVISARSERAKTEHAAPSVMLKVK